MFASAITGFLFLAIVSPEAVPVVAPSDPGEVVVEIQSGWVFEGCWTQFSAGPCKDIYRDSSGQYWICKDCGTTGAPNKGKCKKITIAQLNSGLWCS